MAVLGWEENGPRATECNGQCSFCGLDYQPRGLGSWLRLEGERPEFEEAEKAGEVLVPEALAAYPADGPLLCPACGRLSS